MQCDIVLNNTIAVVYLARGKDDNYLLSFERFIKSYQNNQSGIKHSFYIIFKGFDSTDKLESAKVLFESIPYTPIYLSDDNFDIGSYIEFANRIDEYSICVLNTASEILGSNWLLKLALNLQLKDVGLVGSTGSYESLSELNSIFPKFPNIHIRSTGFMVNRYLFLKICDRLSINSKFDSFLFESGPQSLSQRVLLERKKILLVGRNGRGYSPPYWPQSDTFRQGRQENLLIADNQTRNYLELTWNEKKEYVMRTWGQYIREESILYK